jgi:trans-aconitate methyltransferase
MKNALTSSYDEHARLQRKSAVILTNRMPAHWGLEKIHGIDIGCGTGILAQCVLDRFKNIHISLNDLCKERLSIAHKRLLPKNVTLFHEAMETLVLPKNIQAVFSNFSLQWAKDITFVLEDLTPHWVNKLALAIPVEGSLAHWYDILRSHNISVNFSFPKAHRITSFLEKNQWTFSSLFTHSLDQNFSSALDLMKHFKAINVQHGIHKPSFSSTHSLMRYKGDITMAYNVLFLVAERPL